MNLNNITIKVEDNYIFDYEVATYITFCKVFNLKANKYTNIKVYNELSKKYQNLNFTEPKLKELIIKTLKCK